MSFQKLTIKVAIETPSELDVQSFMSTMGDWIQNETVPGTLIDVADYTHMVDGPGVVLVSHEANWGLDEQDGWKGLSYGVKIEKEETLAEQIIHAYKTVLIGCEAIEETPRHDGLEFAVGNFTLVVNDRMTGVQNSENQAMLKEATESFLKDTLGCSDYSVTIETDSKKRLGVKVEANDAPSVKEGLAKVS